jgi:glc operon protein GlcG
VATDKARTAAIYRRESRDFEDQVAGGRRPSALHLARAVPLQGGIPITVDGQVVGAVGVSGATSADEDRELAQIGVAAAESAATTRNGHAAYFPGATVRQKFETGGLLLEKPQYKIDAGRRTGPGDVEIHDHEVDVMHVLQGSATVVAGEETHKLSEGDVLEIPAGVPHQFTDSSDPFLYFVVKVAS